MALKSHKQSGRARAEQHSTLPVCFQINTLVVIQLLGDRSIRERQVNLVMPPSCKSPHDRTSLCFLSCCHWELRESVLPRAAGDYRLHRRAGSEAAAA